jgi:protein TonB
MAKKLLQPQRDIFDLTNQYRDSFVITLLIHVALAIFLLLPGSRSEPLRVLAQLDFEFYDPLGGEPGGGNAAGSQPEEVKEPEPEPEQAPEPEPEPEPVEEIPQFVESVSEKAEEAPPPPPPPQEKPKEKPKPKPKPKAVQQAAVGPPSDNPGTGTGQEGTGQGGVGGGTGRGNPDALAAYKSAVQRRLERNKKYPPMARNNRIQGIVYVTFTINKSGQVVNSHIVNSSGYPVLDDEAMALLRRVNPLPSIPDEVRANVVTLTAPLQFRMR